MAPVTNGVAMACVACLAWQWRGDGVRGDGVRYVFGVRGVFLTSFDRPEALME